MEIHFFKRMRNFFKTTLIGGLVALLPLSLIVIVMTWIVNLVEKYFGPLVRLINTDSRFYTVLLYLLAVILFLVILFSIGLIIKTSWGRFLNHVLEQKYLMKIPGYKLARETVKQFFGKNKSFFREVVLVDPFNSGTLMTGFITDDQGDVITVFVPTGPNPTSGNIMHIPAERVVRSNTSIDVGMKSIIGCGAGSKEVFDNIQKKSSDETPA